MSEKGSLRSLKLFDYTQYSDEKFKDLFLSHLEPRKFSYLFSILLGFGGIVLFLRHDSYSTELIDRFSIASIYFMAAVIYFLIGRKHYFVKQDLELETASLNLKLARYKRVKRFGLAFAVLGIIGMLVLILQDQAFFRFRNFIDLSFVLFCIWGMLEGRFTMLKVVKEYKRRGVSMEIGVADQSSK